MAKRARAAAGIEVREAGAKGKGVFATRAFPAADVVMRFVAPLVSRRKLPDLTPWQREHLAEVDVGVWQVLPEPRCYLNHACEPNAIQTPDRVYARREIQAGEEITLDYRLNAYDDGTVWRMTCECPAFAEPHDVFGDFFSLPPEKQRDYLPVAPPFIRAMYERRHPNPG